MKWVQVVALGIILTACANRSADVTASYVSPFTYQNHSCQQLSQEAERISARAVQLSGAQDSKATRDAVATTVGVIVFWPVLFAVRGDDATTAELARMKGEMEAIEKASIQKKCGITFQRSSEPQANSVS
jgi:hypothetical protein